MYLFSISEILLEVTGETTNSTAFFMIHACAISIVRAVGVTKTVSHPYGFQSEILLLKPVLHEGIQNWQLFGCEEIGYGLLH